MKKVGKVAKEKEADWWDISEAERHSIEKGLAEADKKEFIIHDDVMKQIKAKYNPEE
jgi:predicted transcriptional regulator